jgi:hypothetical protein
MKIKETELAAAVIEYLQSAGWEVYQEVKPGEGGSIADIVAVRGKIIWIIECKVSGIMKVIGQALQWKRDANFVSIAVPAPGDYVTKDAMKQITTNLGLGVIYARNESAFPAVSPKLNRRISDRIQKALNEKQKTACPAGSRGGYWTPFRETSQNVINYVRDYPGCTMAEMMAGIKHHYGSDVTARANILAWIKAKVIKNIRIEKTGKKLQLFLESGEKPKLPYRKDGFRETEEKKGEIPEFPGTMGNEDKKGGSGQIDKNLEEKDDSLRSTEFK